MCCTWRFIHIDRKLLSAAKREDHIVEKMEPPQDAVREWNKNAVGRVAYAAVECECIMDLQR